MAPASGTHTLTRGGAGNEPAEHDMPRDRSTIEDLRRVIDCLPTHTREAMLEGIRVNEIIVGAYSDRDGGVCPMLAAHRCGGRTSFISFARAWDAFTGVKRARRATERELAVLERHLVASLAAEGSATVAGTGEVDLRSAIAEHQAASRDRRSREAADTGGWGFLKERRERQDAERALERAER
ncbi:MAG: hypothetical protein JWO90_2978, partial [Solirubrobacterales bacterium]|nr:hypothetical protein [Solirubrobacterales bacterium]